MNPKNVLIVVYGMGEQHRNSSLVGVVRPIIGLITRRGDPNRDSHIDGTLAIFREWREAGRPDEWPLQS